MSAKSLPHLDERLGRVAIDMHLLTKEQIDSCQFRVILSRTEAGPEISFGEAAIELGYLTRDDFERLAAEEQRRRRLINGYEIVDHLGSGTIATVYRARQIAMDRDVALKILHPRLATDPVFVNAYIAEAQAVSRFHHPNIVQGFDSGESNGFYYFAHEYLSGGSLADKLARIRAGEERLSENRLLQYLRQTTAALRHAWAVAVYHGDINPGNLLLDGQGTIKLANLGVPRVAQPKRDSEAGQRRKQDLGLRFIRCGPEYAAPEQIDSPETVNAQTDIYNLGATFYNLSFAVPPFPGGNRSEILDYRRRNPVPLFSLKVQEEFSGKYLRLLHDMLQVEPAKRPANPEELADRLEKFHLPDSAEDPGGLAQQVRQVAGPYNTSGSIRRRLPRAPAPVPDGSDRKFSLAARSRTLGAGRGGYWALAGLAALAAAMIAAFWGN